MVNFGETLKKLRTKAGMTQAELAKRLNVTKSVVSYYELSERNPSPDVLIQLSQIFGVSTDYLLGLNHKRIADVIDISDLDDDDVQFLILTVETLRKKKNKQ